jgi:hypothetical protein
MMTSESPESTLIGVQTWAKQVGVSEYRAWREVSAGSVRSIRVSGRRYVFRSEIVDWPARKLAEQREVNGAGNSEAEPGMLSEWPQRRQPAGHRG